MDWNQTKLNQLDWRVEIHLPLVFDLPPVLIRISHGGWMGV